MDPADMNSIESSMEDVIDQKDEIIQDEAPDAAETPQYADAECPKPQPDEELAQEQKLYCPCSPPDPKLTWEQVLAQYNSQHPITTRPEYPINTAPAQRG
ncbi:MAG: hypothetical protein ABSC17_11650 [Thermacetogeniaceae bacterium]